MRRGTGDFEDPEPFYTPRRQPRQYTAAASIPVLDADEALLQSEDNEFDPTEGLATGPWGYDPHNDGTVAISGMGEIGEEYEGDIVDRGTFAVVRDDRDVEMVAGTDGESRIVDHLPQLKARSRYPEQLSGHDMPMYEDGREESAPRFRVASSVATSNTSSRRIMPDPEVQQTPHPGTIIARVPRKGDQLGISANYLPIAGDEQGREEDLQRHRPTRTVIGASVPRQTQLAPISDSSNPSVPKTRLREWTTVAEAPQPLTRSHEYVQGEAQSTQGSVIRHKRPTATALSISGSHLPATGVVEGYTPIHRPTNLPSTLSESSLVLSPIQDIAQLHLNSTRPRSNVDVFAQGRTQPTLPIQSATTNTVYRPLSLRHTTAKAPVSSLHIAPLTLAPITSLPDIKRPTMADHGTSAAINTGILATSSASMMALLHPLPSASVLASLTAAPTIPHEGDTANHAHTCTNPNHKHGPPTQPQTSSPQAPIVSDAPASTTNAPATHARTANTTRDTAVSAGTQTTEDSGATAVKGMSPAMAKRLAAAKANREARATLPVAEDARDTPVPTKPILRQVITFNAEDAPPLDDSSSRPVTRRRDAAIATSTRSNTSGSRPGVDQDGTHEQIVRRTPNVARVEVRSGGAAREDSGENVPVRSKGRGEVARTMQRSGADGREDSLPTLPSTKQRKERSVAYIESQSGNLRPDTRDKSRPTTRHRDAIPDYEEKIAEADRVASTSERDFRGLNPRRLTSQA